MGCTASSIRDRPTLLAAAQYPDLGGNGTFTAPSHCQRLLCTAPDQGSRQNSPSLARLRSTPRASHWGEPEPACPAPVTAAGDGALDRPRPAALLSPGAGQASSKHPIAIANHLSTKASIASTCTSLAPRASPAAHPHSTSRPRGPGDRHDDPPESVPDTEPCPVSCDPEPRLQMPPIAPAPTTRLLVSCLAGEPHPRAPGAQGALGDRHRTAPDDAALLAVDAAPGPGPEPGLVSEAESVTAAATPPAPVQAKPSTQPPQSRPQPPQQPNPPPPGVDAGAGSPQPRPPDATISDANTARNASLLAEAGVREAHGVGCHGNGFGGHAPAASPDFAARNMAADAARSVPRNPVRQPPALPLPWSPPTAPAVSGGRVFVIGAQTGFNPSGLSEASPAPTKESGQLTVELKQLVRLDPGRLGGCGGSGIGAMRELRDVEDVLFGSEVRDNGSISRGPFLTYFSAACHPTRAVSRTLLSTHDYWRFWRFWINACNPILFFQGMTSARDTPAQASGPTPKAMAAYHERLLAYASNPGATSAPPPPPGYPAAMGRWLRVVTTPAPKMATPSPSAGGNGPPPPSYAYVHTVSREVATTCPADAGPFDAVAGEQGPVMLAPAVHACSLADLRGACDRIVAAGKVWQLRHFWGDHF